MSSLTPTLEDIRVGAIIGSTFAIVVTSFRLFLRARKRSLWWDDAWAAFSMACICLLLTGILIFTAPHGTYNHSTTIAGYYLVDQPFYGVIWTARQSMLCTIIRLSFGRLRKILKWTILIFAVTWAVLFAQVWWTCEREPGWKQHIPAQCSLGREVAIAQVITDVFCDMVLIIAPSYIFWNYLLDRKGLKIRLTAVFSTTIFTTIFSLVHAYAIFQDLGLLEFMLAVVETVVSLTVINLSVITSWIFNLADKDALSETPTMRQSELVTFGSRPVRTRRGQLTTFGGDVELGRTEIMVTTVLEDDHKSDSDRPFRSQEDLGVKAGDMSESKSAYGRM